jgi:hypothetical protein
VAAMIGIFLVFAAILFLGAFAIMVGLIWVGVYVHRKQKEAGLWGPPQDGRQWRR